MRLYKEKSLLILMAIGLGIDIGADSIKAVQVQVSGGRISVTGALKIPREELVQPGGEKSAAGALAIPPTLGQELTKARMRKAGFTYYSIGRRVVGPGK